MDHGLQYLRTLEPESRQFLLLTPAALVARTTLDRMNNLKLTHVIFGFTTSRLLVSQHSAFDFHPLLSAVPWLESAASIYRVAQSILALTGIAAHVSSRSRLSQDEGSAAITTELAGRRERRCSASPATSLMFPSSSLSSGVLIFAHFTDGQSREGWSH